MYLAEKPILKICCKVADYFLLLSKVTVKHLVLITAGLNMSPVARLKKTVSFILTFVFKLGFL